MQHFYHKRDRLGSEAITAAESPSKEDEILITIKPKDDPDAPPELQLQLKNLSFEEKTCKKPEEHDCDSQRPRAKTSCKDNQFSILTFLGRKPRGRHQSEEFGKKIGITDLLK